MKSKGFAFLLCSVGVLSVAVAIARSDEAPEDDDARRAQVIVRAGDEVKITVGQVEDAINKQSPFLRARYEDPDKLREFIDDMVRFELLAREAERRDYDEHEAVVRTVKQNAVQRLVRKEFDEEITPQSVSDAAVREYYEDNRDEFRRPETIRAAHILVDSEKEAKALLQKAKDADQREFRELAREHSIDSETKHRGGDLRYFTKEGRPRGSRDAPVAPELVAAAFALDEEGAVVSSPVQVGDNYSVLKVTARRSAQKKTLEAAEHSIRLRLWRKQRQDAVEDFVASLREKYEPEIHPDRMRPIQLETAAPSPGFPEHAHGGPAEGEAPAAEGEAPAAEGEAPAAPPAGETE
ncbi:MAG: peptidylprolyl isomerase [Myxococcota bacterium]